MRCETSGNLTQVTGLENIVQTFQYNDPNDAHNITHIQDHANATVSFPVKATVQKWNSGVVEQI